MKKETLEEAAKFLNEKFDGNGVSVEIIDWSKNERYAYPPTELLKQYSKWQQEQDKKIYSEEEVIDLLQEINDHPVTLEGRIAIREWFKDFKNK